MTRNRVLKVVSFAFIVFYSVWSIFPLAWMILTSLKTNLQLSSIPPVWLFTPTLENYSYVLENTPFFRAFMNSLIICLSATGLSLLIGSFAAYSFSRLRFRGSKIAAFGIIVMRMLPPIVMVIPLFLIARATGLYDQHITLILVYAALSVSFVVWMLKAFFDEIPAVLEESAMIDGCTRLKAFLKITFPLAGPGIAATSIFSFILSWNDYLFASLLTGVNAKTVPVTLSEVVGGEIGINWGQMAAEGTIFVIPVLIFAWVIQRHLVRGLTMGAVKG